MYARDEWSDAEEQQAWRPTVQLTDEQFDELQATLDEPDLAPNLERAARRRAQQYDDDRNERETSEDDHIMFG